jgi:uncharacterized protein (TIGR02147 family)
MNSKSLFKFMSYKAYLRNAFGGSQARTGIRKKAAAWMKCQTAYLSQVLNGSANLSLEQADLLSEFLGHDGEEREFFLLLVQYERAGTKSLENFFQLKINQHLERRQTIRHRIQSEEGLSVVDQAVYYSKWYYSCIHVLISIPELQTKAALAKALNLPLPTISEVLEFLETRGLAVFENGHFRIGPRHLHLAHDSPHITKHHSNWRGRAMASLDVPQENDLHYSVVVTLSQDDVLKIKAKVVDLIQESMAIVRDSKEESAYGFTLDWFNILSSR